jgi:hypothetical protein
MYCFVYSKEITILRNDIVLLWGRSDPCMCRMDVYIFIIGPFRWATDGSTTNTSERRRDVAAFSRETADMFHIKGGGKDAQMYGVEVWGEQTRS